MTILEVRHIRDGEVIWEERNLKNTLHLEGEQFILSALFRTITGVSVPSFYYLGLDNRTSLLLSDNMATLSTEPTGNGYSRQPISSSTGFALENYSSGGYDHWKAKSQIVAFTASGSQWGPVSNVFLTDRVDDSGFLISTAALGVTRVVLPTESLTFRFTMTLVDV